MYASKATWRALLCSDRECKHGVIWPVPVEHHHVCITLVVDSCCLQALSGQLSNKDVSDKDMTDSANATYSRIRLLQDHLCTYAERNVPVIPISFANFSDTLDQLHDYLLQCIESAMAQC